MKIYLEPDLSGNSDEEKILGDMNGKILSMLAINNHNIQALVYHFFAADFKKEDLLTPSITVTEEEKWKVSSDITTVNTREERIEMALGHGNKITGFSDPPASSFGLSAHFFIFRSKVKPIT